MAGPEQLPVAEAKAGDADAWDTLFRRYQLPLYAYVFELVHDEQASLDLVQETFINAVRHIGSLREEGRFGSWLFSIAHQKIVQRWRRPERAEPLDEEHTGDPPDEQDNPRDWLLRREQEEQFMTLVSQLPLPQRSVLLLHFVEDFSLEDIAAVTDVSVGTVKSRMHYAKKALRKLMKEKTP